MSVFQTHERDGNEVRLSKTIWNNKILIGHPEMTNKEDLVKDTIENPEATYQSKTNFKRKVFQSQNIKTGFWAGTITTVVVHYDINTGIGSIVTAYLTGLAYNGAVLWKK